MLCNIEDRPRILFEYWVVGFWVLWFWSVMSNHFKSFFYKLHFHSISSCIYKIQGVTNVWGKSQDSTANFSIIQIKCLSNSTHMIFVRNRIWIIERWRTSECWRDSRYLLCAWCRCHTWGSSENCWRGRQGRYRIAYRKGICLQSSCRRRKWIFECHLLKIQFMVQRVNKDKWSLVVVRVCLRG